MKKQWAEKIVGIVMAVAFIAIGIGVLSPNYKGVSLESDAFANSCTAGVTIAGKVSLEKGLSNVATASRLKVAILNTAAQADQYTTAYGVGNAATSYEWTGAGYSAGGYTLTNTSFTNSGGISYVSFDALNPGNVTANAPSTCAIIYDTGFANTVLWIVTYASMQPTGGPFTTTAWTNALGYQ